MLCKTHGGINVLRERSGGLLTLCQDIKPINADEFSKRVYDAFAVVRMDGGVSRIEADYMDNREIASDRLITCEEKDDWAKLIDDRLCDFMVTFCYTDHQGFRFYIAPYIIWTLENSTSSDAVIADFTVYAIDAD